MSDKPTYIPHLYLDVSEPYKQTYLGEVDGEVVVHVEIRLDQIVDAYAYHDFPNTADLWLNKEQLLEAIGKLKEIADSMKGE